MAFTMLLFDFLNPEMIIRYGGLVLLLLIIFAETGLFFGFFLPGDSLLFMAGLLTETEYINKPVGVVIVLLIIAAVAGTSVGYFFGHWAENYLKHRKENFFYKRKYLDMARDFYKRYGMMAFVVGRFLPIIRTFVPILAGMVRIDFKKFLLYNFLGAVLWIVTMVMAGYWLGNLFPSLTEHVEIIVVGMVVVTAIPVIVSYRRHSKAFAKENQDKKEEKIIL
jgi:membrane-associated protein